MNEGQFSLQVASSFRPLLAPARYKGAWGGRASGKSVFYADLAILKTLQSKCSIVCVREFQSSIRESVHRLLSARIEEHGLAHLFKVQEQRILCPNGGRIIFVGMHDQTADRIKSLADYDIAWVEEAQTLSQKSLDILRPTIRKPGSEIWFSWNPSEPDDPVDLFLRSDNIPPNSIVVHANFKDNPWVPQVMLDEANYEQQRDPAKFNHVWLGEYQTRDDSLVFKHWKTIDFETPSDAEFLYGIDFGFSADPSAGVRCYVKGKQLFIDHEVYGHQVETADLPAFFLQLPEISRWVSIADSARPEHISHLKRNGIPKMMSAVKGQGSVEFGIDHIRSFDVFIHPRCVETIKEFSKYSYKVSKHTDHVLPELEQGNDHCLDSLRYALEPLRKKTERTKPVQPQNRNHQPSAGNWMG